MTTKGRLSATVDEDVLEAGRQAVAEGRADNLSEWVNDALRRQAEHERRLGAIDEFLADYEAELGEITDAEIEAASRLTRGRAVVIRGNPSGSPKVRSSRGRK